MNLLLTIPEFRQLAGGMSHGTFYKLKNAGAIPTVKIGRRTYVRRTDAEAWIAALPAA